MTICCFFVSYWKLNIFVFWTYLLDQTSNLKSREFKMSIFHCFVIFSINSSKEDNNYKGTKQSLLPHSILFVLRVFLDCECTSLSLLWTVWDWSPEKVHRLSSVFARPEKKCDPTVASLSGISARAALVRSFKTIIKLEWTLKQHESAAHKQSWALRGQV